MPGKVKYHQLTDNQKKEYLGTFYDMVSSLQDREEAKNFFKDLLTLSETVMIARRIQIANLLLKGKTHNQIRNNLKVGFTTIASVEKWLHNGFGGYKKTISEYNKKNKAKSKSKNNKWSQISPYSLEHIRKKYPLHFILCNALMREKKINKKNKS